MLSLVLRGKLGISEDVLTAAVFDAVADRCDTPLLIAILAEAGIPGLNEDHDLAVELWPRTIAGEPDVRIVASRCSQHVATILVEAKLWAPKSATGAIADDGSSGDQLARYLLAECGTAPRVHLLYLTHHALAPEDDLADSAAHLGAKGRQDLIDRIHWLSWRSVERHLASSPDPAYRRVRDVLRRARMYWFDGMRLEVPPSTPSVEWTYRTNPITYHWRARESWRSTSWRYLPSGGVYAWSIAERPSGGSRFYRGGA